MQSMPEGGLSQTESTASAKASNKLLAEQFYDVVAHADRA